MLNHYEFVMFCCLHCVTVVLGCLLLLHNESTSAVELTSQAAVIFYVHTYGVYIRN